MKNIKFAGALVLASFILFAACRGSTSSGDDEGGKTIYGVAVTLKLPSTSNVSASARSLWSDISDEVNHYAVDVVRSDGDVPNFSDDDVASGTTQLQITTLKKGEHTFTVTAYATDDTSAPIAAGMKTVTLVEGDNTVIITMIPESDPNVDLYIKYLDNKIYAEGALNTPLKFTGIISVIFESNPLLSPDVGVITQASESDPGLIDFNSLSAIDDSFLESAADTGLTVVNPSNEEPITDAVMLLKIPLTIGKAEGTDSAAAAGKNLKYTRARSLGTKTITEEFYYAYFKEAAKVTGNTTTPAKTYIINNAAPGWNLLYEYRIYDPSAGQDTTVVTDNFTPQDIPDTAKWVVY